MTHSCKQNKIRIIAIVFLTAMLFLLSILPHIFLGAKASGDMSYGPENITYTINLDVNGRSSGSNTEINNISDINEGATYYKTRNIFLTAIFKDKQSNATWQSYLGKYKISKVTVDGNDSYNVYNSATDNVKITVGNGGVSFTAEALRAKSDARVSMKLVKDASATGVPDTLMLYLKFNIVSSFAPARDSAVDTVIATGEKTFSALNTAAVDDILFLRLNDNNVTKYDLSSMLVGKPLKYKTKTGGENDRGEILMDNGAPWTIKDVSNFTLTGVSVANATIRDALNFVAMNDSSGTNSPKFTLNINITNANMAALSEADRAKFWYTDLNPNKHALILQFTDRLGLEGKVSIDVAFVEYEAPKPKNSYNFITELNASSLQDCELSDKSDIPDAGYRSILIKPEYLVEFPSITRKPYFRDAEVYKPSVADSNTVSVTTVQIEGSSECYYRVNAKQSGTSTVEFYVLYDKTTGGDDKVPVTVNFKVIGLYNIALASINGKKPVVYTMQNEFQALRNDTYQLSKIEYADEESKNFVIAEFDDNKNLQVMPLKSGTANLKLTFKDLKGQTVVMTQSISVNLSGGDWYGSLFMYQKVLLIIGVVIVSLGLIMFIIWMFYRGVSKRRQDELSTSAPTSAYIIKLNSTIAATQAQQRIAATQSFSTAQSQMLQLGAGSTISAAPPNTLQLGVSQGFGSGGPLNMPPIGDLNVSAPPPAPEEIFIPISDEDLLERIFVEKYEPRGMTRRSFFKSKELQNRELEKEKGHIRDRVRSGMSIDEACKSDKQRGVENAISTPGDISAATAEDPLVVMLGFDPDQPLAEKIETKPEIEPDSETTEQEIKLNKSENDFNFLVNELSALTMRMEKTQAALDKTNEKISSNQDSIGKAEQSITKLKEEITDLEVTLASAKSKEKERISKEITSKEEKISKQQDIVNSLNNENAENEKTVHTLNGLILTYGREKSEKDNIKTTSEQELNAYKEELRKLKDELARAKAAQQLRLMLNDLNPLMVDVNILDRDIRDLDKETEYLNAQKSNLKLEAANVQSKMLGATDMNFINSLSTRTNDINKSISEIDRKLTSNAKLKTDKTVAMTGVKRKCNEYIESKDIQVEDVIKEEDLIIGNIELDRKRIEAEKDRVASEENIGIYQAAYDEIVANGNIVVETAMKVAKSIQGIEEELSDATILLDEINAKMENANDDDKLMMSIDQMTYKENVEFLTKKLEDAKTDGLKTNTEAKVNYDAKLEEARVKLEQAKSEFEDANDRIGNKFMNINPLDLITSGSGVMSVERKKHEAENLKKQLELSKRQAEQAQIEAQKAISDAQKASDASKAEAEKLAQEAIAKAEEARRAAEAKATEEAEKAKQIAEDAKRQAEETAETAKRQAEEAKRAAEENAERIKREAEEAAEKAKREAAETAEKVKREASEETEKIKREAEEAKRQADEKNAKLSEKLTKRKSQIAELRTELKSVKDESSASELREKFYNIQLSLDDDEKSNGELNDLLIKSMEDATHAGEISRYKEMANKEPRVVKKVVEKTINRTRAGAPRPGGARPGARPGGARPGSAPPRAGAAPRPGGARPGSAPPRAGAAPRPNGARPGSAPPRAGAAPRPNGARPGSAPPRPNGARPPRKPE